MRFEIPTTTEGQFNFPNGTVKHYQKGRKEGLVILPDGTQKWYKNNTLHRVGQPAVICANGKTEWYSYGIRHATVYFKEQYKEDGKNIIHNINDVAIIIERCCSRSNLGLIRNIACNYDLWFEEAHYVVDGVFPDDEYEFNTLQIEHSRREDANKRYTELSQSLNSDDFRMWMYVWGDTVKKYVSQEKYNDLVQRIEQHNNIKIISKDDLEKTFNQKLLII